MDEEQRLWGGLCADFPVLLDRATAYWLGREFDELLDRTRRRTGVSIWEWKDLLDELAVRRDSEQDHSWRGGEETVPAPPRRIAARPPEIRFGCPAELCDRRVAGSLLGSPPRCELFGLDMAEIP